MASKKRFWLLTAIILLILAGAGSWLLWSRHRPASPPVVNTNPVPASVSQAVNFPVYYPDSEKLPAGYTLNANSFSSPVKNGVSYSVSYDTDKKMVFSVQQKPTDAELDSFNSNYIPLRIDYQTPLGQAEIGAYHNQTLVSLPILGGPWVIMTAPPDINQDLLKAVISSLRQ